MNWRKASIEDSDVLAHLNSRLIEDEGHRNPMSLDELKERMKGFLLGEYTAILFEQNEQVLGYALFHPQDDFLYLRQFFIERNFRRKGIGTEAMKILLDEIFPKDKRLVVSVLSENARALNFWKAVGFSDYCNTLEILPRN